MCQLSSNEPRQGTVVSRGYVITPGDNLIQTRLSREERACRVEGARLLYDRSQRDLFSDITFGVKSTVVSDKIIKSLLKNIITGGDVPCSLRSLVCFVAPLVCVLHHMCWILPMYRATESCFARDRRCSFLVAAESIAGWYSVYCRIFTSFKLEKQFDETNMIVLTDRIIQLLFSNYLNFPD